MQTSCEIKTTCYYKACSDRDSGKSNQSQVTGDPAINRTFSWQKEVPARAEVIHAHDNSGVLSSLGRREILDKRRGNEWSCRQRRQQRLPGTAGQQTKHVLILWGCFREAFSSTAQTDKKNRNKNYYHFRFWTVLFSFCIRYIYIYIYIYI